MILVDYSNIVSGCIMTQTSCGKLPINMEEFRIYVLNTLRTLRVNYKNPYGEIVLACDSPKSWRKEFFPFYKGTRGKQKSYTNLNWSEAYKCFAELKEELRTHFPYKIIEVMNAEADDVIGVIGGNVKEPTIIISGDSDFKQLHSGHVKQYSIHQRGFVVCNDPKHALELKIIEGDRTDGIPNVLSDDDTFMTPGKRQNTMTAKRLAQLLDPEYEKPSSVKRNYDRNRTLIDLKNTPKDLFREILQQYIQTKPVGRALVLPYMVEHKMSNLTSCLQDF
jgi:hypothetical protein